PTTSVLSRTGRPDKKCPARAERGVRTIASSSRNRIAYRTRSQRVSQAVCSASRTSFGIGWLFPEFDCIKSRLAQSGSRPFRRHNGWLRRLSAALQFCDRLIDRDVPAEVADFFFDPQSAQQVADFRMAPDHAERNFALRQVPVEPGNEVCPGDIDD